MKDKKEKKMLYVVIATVVVVLAVVIADGLLYYTSLQEDGVGRGLSRYFQREDKEKAQKEDNALPVQQPVHGEPGEVYVYYNSELIRESQSWSEPSFYVTNDDIEDVLFFYETSYPDYNYNVIFDQYYEFLHYEAEEMNEEYGSEETNEWLEENMVNDIFVYRVEVVEFTYLEEYFAINEITDLEVEEGSILIAVYYHR